MTGVKQGSLYSWLRLIRTPNLFTVPGDPLLGFFLLHSSCTNVAILRCIPPVASSLLLYIAGIISNDYFDLKENRKNRPERPLVDGSIKPTTAIVAASIFAVLGILIASTNGIITFLTAVALAAAILLYNTVLKHIDYLGTMMMGMCRGLSVLLGAGAFFNEMLSWKILIAPVLGITVYIALVTSIARRETERVTIGAKRFGPFMVLLTSYAVTALTFCLESQYILLSLLLITIALLRSFTAAITLSGTPEANITGKVTGINIRNLLFMQAAFLTLSIYPAPLLALVLTASVPVSSALAKRFYSS